MLKKSKYFGRWKDRYIQLTHNYLFTFEPGKEKGTHLTFPTEFIPLTSIQIVQTKHSDEKEKEHFNQIYIYG